MRLKKIPAGIKVIMFTNPYPINCVVYWNKKPFLRVEADSYKIIQIESFFVGSPLKEFPEMQLYSNVKLEIEYK